MGGELSTAVNECTEIVETPRFRTIRNVRLVGMAFRYAATRVLRPFIFSTYEPGYCHRSSALYR